jgi:hypothetical protein
MLSLKIKNLTMKILSLLLYIQLGIGTVIAQHQRHHSADSTKKDHSGHQDTTHVDHTMDMPPMSHAFSLQLPMSRNGSGTAWLPDNSPMYGYMLHGKKWMYMFHGNIFVRYNNQDIFDKGVRGDSEFDAVSWLMAMGQRRIGHRGLFHFSTMLSADPLFGGDGYPLLFQTGESYNGRPLVDRQHPHDLFSELSVSYTHSMNDKTDVFIYAAYPGEPALGSVAFMHRVSSLYGPDAPLSHHWNDGTHITFGVATLGIRYGKFKLDGSVFTGREPDEKRYNFDRPRFDSFSARLSYNPTASWSFQVSGAYVESPELLDPLEDIYRATASAVYSKPFGTDNFLNVTGLWAVNRSDHDEHALLMEAALVIKRFSTYARYEFVQKSSEELDLDESSSNGHTIYDLQAATLGLGYDLFRSAALRVAVGGQGSFYVPDSRLHSLYGRAPVAAEIFIRIYPPRMQMNR